MIDYPSRYRSALVSMVRGLLEEAAAEGLPGDSAFYLSFQTGWPDVGISPTLRDVYPETMTIVLQHQFWDLVADDDGFSVTLRFGGRPESLFVPWDALTSFVDPSAEFGFELPEAEGPGSTSSEEGEDTASGGSSSSEAGGVASREEEQPPSEVGEVVSFDRFRDARQPKEPS